MGTNYYLKLDACPHCQRPARELHIGKSSAGWCFGLHVIEDEKIKSLADWETLFTTLGNEIRNEYDAKITAKEMLSIIKERSWKRSVPWTHEEYERNHAEDGPNGLARSKVDGRHCIGHGDGTWDLLPGEFS